MGGVPASLAAAGEGQGVGVPTGETSNPKAHAPLYPADARPRARERLPRP